eukprot:m.63876 g.63876  ORF g.63876 m.63876 type:complete len:208 (+) comp11609_c0_seq2:3371-3994(+)
MGKSKELSRIFDKAKHHYDGDFNRILDYERCSFVFEDFLTMQQVLKRINDSKKIKLVRIKNRFLREVFGIEDTLGYRDCQIIVELRDSKLLFEIQFHIAPLYNLKTSAIMLDDNDTRTGHEYYRSYRFLKETMLSKFKEKWEKILEESKTKARVRCYSNVESSTGSAAPLKRDSAKKARPVSVINMNQAYDGNSLQQPLLSFNENII